MIISWYNSMYFDVLCLICVGLGPMSVYCWDDCGNLSSRECWLRIFRTYDVIYHNFSTAISGIIYFGQSKIQLFKIPFQEKDCFITGNVELNF